ncbi:MAG: hypothetical protein ACOCVR_04885, partial [Myxococcota bacterium]
FYVWTVPENPHESYSSQALDAVPMPGVRVQAPEGALDRPREIEVKRLSARRASSAAERLDGLGYVMEAALDFDAGMDSADRLRKPVELSFDLDELGVEPSLRRYAGLMAEEEDGRLVRQATRVEGDRLEWSTTHNGPIFIVVGLSTIFGLTKYGLVDPDRRAETQDEEWFGFSSDSGHFNVLWPVDVQTNAGTAADAFERLERLWEEYRTARRTGRLPPPPAPGVPSPHADFDSYLLHLHQIIESLEETVGDREWQKRHWAHPAAVVVAEALDFAHSYLTGRGFTPPAHVVNVYLRDTWTHSSEVLGLAENLMTRDPFISLQLRAVPVQNRTDRLRGEKGVDLEVTLVHELFHIFQTQYGPGEYLDRNSFWIGEATALTLERELWPAYRGRLESEELYQRALTRRNQYWYAYRFPMEPSGITGFGAFVFTDNTSLQHHGYGYSYFFEHVKRELGGRPLDFLPGFYRALHTTGSAAGALQALSRAGGKELPALYEAFVRANSNDIAAQPPPDGEEKIDVTANGRRFAWLWRDVAPLSSPIHRVEISEQIPGYDQAVIVLETGSMPGAIKMRYRGLASRQWSEVTDPVTIVPAMPASHRARSRHGFLLQAIGAYSPMEEAPGAGAWWLTYLLPPPSPPELPQGPRLDLERIDEGREETLLVRWQKSPLAGDPAYRRAFPMAFRGQDATDALRSSSHVQRTGHEAFEYRLEIETWADDSRTNREVVQVDRERAHTSIPWDEVFPPEPEDRMKPFEIRVRMREVLVLGERVVEGGLGPVGSIIIDPMSCEETLFRVSVKRGGSGDVAEEFSFYLMPEQQVLAAAADRKGSALTARDREDVLNATFASSMRTP